VIVLLDLTNAHRIVVVIPLARRVRRGHSPFAFLIVQVNLWLHVIPINTLQERILNRSPSSVGRM
jgi:hypothetical protein